MVVFYTGRGADTEKKCLLVVLIVRLTISLGLNIKYTSQCPKVRVESIGNNGAPRDGEPCGVVGQIIHKYFIFR